MSRLTVPEREAKPESFVDWLELAALFNAGAPVNIMEVVEQLDLDADTHETDGADADTFRESRASEIGAEIKHRQRALGPSYPFVVLDRQSRLSLGQPLTKDGSVYLLTLLLSHSPKSEIVPSALAPSAARLKDARDLFQICATAAAAAHVRGPSFSIGWSSTNTDKILSKLRSAWATFPDGILRQTPPPIAPRQVKDDGIDVLAFWTELDGRPSRGFLVGQAASGHREWRDKDTQDAISHILEYFDTPPASRPHGATFIPFYLSHEPWNLEHRTYKKHQYISHRTRLARQVREAIALKKSGIGPIERINELPKIVRWVKGYLSDLTNMQP